MMYITVEENEITGIYCGKKEDGFIDVPDNFSGCVGESLSSFDKQFNRLPEQVIQKEAESEVKPLTLVEEIEQGITPIGIGWKIVNHKLVQMSQVEMINAGQDVLPEGMKIVGDSVVIMTPVERINSGLDKLPRGMIIDNGELRPATLLEQVAKSEITQETADTLQALSVRYERDSRYSESDSAIASLGRKIRFAESEGKSTIALKSELVKWDEYAQALSDLPEQSGFPWNVVFPVSPSGVEA